MKIKRKKNIWPIIIIIVVVVIAAAVTAGIFINKRATEIEQDNQDREIQGIAISIVPKVEYYIGDSLDLSGLMIQVIAGTNEYSYHVTYPNAELQISGFDSSVANDELPITVSYKGFTATFNVKIKEHASASPVLEKIEISDNFKTTYKLDEWNRTGPDYTGVYLTLIYSDGSKVENIQLKAKHIYNAVQQSAAGETEIVIKYSDGVTTVELPITITITE